MEYTRFQPTHVSWQTLVYELVSLRGDQSQDAFARQVGIDRITVRRWERYETLPSRSHLEKVCAARHVSYTRRTRIMNLRDTAEQETIRATLDANQAHLNIALFLEKRPLIDLTRNSDWRWQPLEAIDETRRRWKECVRRGAHRLVLVESSMVYKQLRHNDSGVVRICAAKAGRMAAESLRALGESGESLALLKQVASEIAADTPASKIAAAIGYGVEHAILVSLEACHAECARAQEIDKQVQLLRNRMDILWPRGRDSTSGERRYANVKVCRDSLRCSAIDTMREGIPTAQFRVDLSEFLRARKETTDPNLRVMHSGIAAEAYLAARDIAHLEAEYEDAKPLQKGILEEQLKLQWIEAGMLSLQGEEHKARTIAADCLSKCEEHGLESSRVKFSLLQDHIFRTRPS